MNICKACGSILYGPYCSLCGQRDKVERISFNYLRKELVHFFTHVEHGFFYTSKQMLLRPGPTVKEFIAGKRRLHQTPISYFLVWITIYLLSMYGINRIWGENAIIDYREYFGPSPTTKFAISHLSLVLTIVIPFQALYLLWLITYKEYNYVESVVAVLYALGTVILLQFLFVVLSVIIYLVARIVVPLQLSDVLKVAYLGWFGFDMTRFFAVRQKWLRAIVFLLLAFGTFTLWRLYGVPQLVRWLL